MTIITAERRILAYEDYHLHTDNMQEYLYDEKEIQAAEHVQSLVIRWNEHGDLGVHFTFADPSGGHYYAQATPPCRERNEDWQVYIARTDDRGKYIERAESAEKFHNLVDGTPILIDAVARVLIAAACVQIDAEEAGYP